MIGRLFRTAGSDPAELRRQEIADRLAACGLARGPRRPGALPWAERTGGPGAAALAEALAGLGPVFGTLARYLATRADLFRLDECRQLAAAASEAEAALPPPAAPAEVAAAIQADLGAPVAELFADFEPAPCTWNRIEQSHRARLPDGRPVVVTVAAEPAVDHPRTAAPRGAPAGGPARFTSRGPSWDLDLELLPALAEALAGGPLGNLPWDEALADFAEGFGRRSDLAARARSQAALAADAADFPLLHAPRLVAERCGPRVLTRAPLPGGEPAPAGREQASSTAAQGGPAGASAPPEGWTRADQARRVTLAWLRQALAGSVFPAELGRGELALLAGGQVAFPGAQEAGLPPATRARLQAYLVAVSAGEADRACALLLPELIAGGRTAVGTAVGTAAGAPGAAGDDAPAAPPGGPDGETEDARVAELRARLRQVVPFRDGAWNDGGSGDTLAEQLCIHWRLAAEHGFRPRPALLRFWRGLCAAAVATRALAPLGDPLREGLEDLRASQALARWRQALTPDGWAAAADRYAAALLELPQRLDEALSRAARGELGDARRGPPDNAASGGGRAGRARQDAAAAATALALAAAAVALLTGRLAAQGVLGTWGERLGAALFALLALLLLRTAGRAA
jgi:ABC1 atypical kinase-like domain